jgi:hypothetical protein
MVELIAECVVEKMELWFGHANIDTKMERNVVN